MNINLPLSPINDDGGDDDYNSVTSSNVEEIEFIDNGILMKSTNKFMDDEKKFYELIKSYCYGSNVELFIQENDTVISSAYLFNDGTVHEHIRGIDKVDNDFVTVWKWVNNVKGSIVTGEELINSVYIGDNYVPFSRIMIDIMEEDDVDEEENEDDDNDDNDNSEYEFMKKTFIIWIVFSIIAIIILAFILMSKE
jgi:hypothetical protein